MHTIIDVINLIFKFDLEKEISKDDGYCRFHESKSD